MDGGSPRRPGPAGSAPTIMGGDAPRPIEKDTMFPSLRLALIGVIAAAAPAIADEPRIEKADLFESGAGGYAHYRIPGIVVTPKGTLFAYCEARKGSKSDWGRIDLMSRRGVDGGRGWEPPRKLAEPPAGATKNPVAQAQGLGKPGEITMNNPVAIVDRRSGAIHVLYCVEYARCFAMRSDDDGLTFSEPVEITATFDRFRPGYDWKVLATGPGHGIQLEGGRLLVAVWLSTGTGSHGHHPSCVATIYSDDGGKTWERGEIVANDPEPSNPNETAAVQLADGRVMLNIRHESRPHGRGVAISPDGISGWSPVRFDESLPEPVCFGSLVRLSKRPEADKDRILFVNPHGRERRNLTVKLSEDDGRTWPAMRAVEPGPSAYADLAVGGDGTIFCFYERGAVGGKPPALCLARFPLEWLMAGVKAPAP